MPKPTEHKTVQARILKYAQEIGWTFVPREEAESRRGFDPDASPKDRAKGASLFFDDLLDIKVRQFNPRYSDAEGALPGRFRHLHADIYGNREFVDYLRNRGKYYDHDEKRELDLILIDYGDDLSRPRNGAQSKPFSSGLMPGTARGRPTSDCSAFCPALSSRRCDSCRPTGCSRCSI